MDESTTRRLTTRSRRQEDTLNRPMLPRIVESDIGSLISRLSDHGYRVELMNEGSMHSYQVALLGPRELIITADKGQLSVEGDRAELEAAGLWKAFDDKQEFESSVLKFLGVAE